MSENPKQGIVLRHPRLNHVGLAELLAERLPASQKAWCLVTRVTDTCFRDFDRATAMQLVTDWTRGRVFCATSEIRWQRTLGAAHSDVLLLCEESTPKFDGFQPVGERWEVTPPGERAMLVAWGSPPDPRAPHIRMETRLPKRLHYPPDCKSGRFRCLCYRDSSGTTQFIRLTGVE
jgi:hypothetical protein